MLRATSILVVCIFLAACATGPKFLCQSPQPDSQIQRPTGIKPGLMAFGLALGQPLAIAECKKTLIGGDPVYAYIPDVQSVCYKRIQNKASCSNPDTEWVELSFPIKGQPAIVPLSSAITGLIINGKLEGVAFNTLGVSDQLTVMQALKEKYGHPIFSEKRSLQNRMGAQFEGLLAGWSTGDVEVEFLGMVNSINQGNVEIDTSTGSAWRKAKRDSATKDNRPL